MKVRKKQCNRKERKHRDLNKAMIHFKNKKSNVVQIRDVKKCSTDQSKQNPPKMGGGEWSQKWFGEQNYCNYYDELVLFLILVFCLQTVLLTCLSPVKKTAHRLPWKNVWMSGTLLTSLLVGTYNLWLSLAVSPIQTKQTRIFMTVHAVPYSFY